MKGCDWPSTCAGRFQRRFRSSLTPSGDIGATVVAQGVALFDVLGADAVTANPYLGIGALAPFLDRTDRFTYLLCRTSNPESAELQSLRVGASDTDPEETLAERVARLAGRRAEGVAGRIGLVVGATDAAALRQVRAAAPGLPLLVPGVGAQGVRQTQSPLMAAQRPPLAAA